jgi:hypothetical protein
MPITLQDGCHLSNVLEFVDLVVTSLSSDFIVDVPAAIVPTYTLRGNTQIHQTGTGTFFRTTAAQRFAVYFRDISSFVTGTCVDAQAAGAFVFLVGAEFGRCSPDTLAAVTGSTIRGIVLSSAVNFQTAQVGLVDSLGVLPLFVLPRAGSTTYDDYLVSPQLNLASSLVQDAIDALKSRPIDALRFTGTLGGDAGATSGFASDPGPGGSLSQVPALYPRGSVSNNVEVYVRVSSNSLLTDANFVFFVEGAPTPVSVLVPAATTGSFSTPTPVAQPVAIGQGVDLEVDTAGGGAGRSITFSTTVRLLP